MPKLFFWISWVSKKKDMISWHGKVYLDYTLCSKIVSANSAQKGANLSRFFSLFFFCKDSVSDIKILYCHQYHQSPLTHQNPLTQLNVAFNQWWIGGSFAPNSVSENFFIFLFKSIFTESHNATMKTKSLRLIWWLNDQYDIFLGPGSDTLGLLGFE
jgi:hypothetical protein